VEMQLEEVDAFIVGPGTRLTGSIGRGNKLRKEVLQMRGICEIPILYP
jgi:hypothetical protein